MTQTFLEKKINMFNITKEEALILIDYYYDRIEDLEDMLAIQKYKEALQKWKIKYISKEKWDKVFKRLLA